ncbi:MAG: putative ABC exporter domain-containing protein [Fastidiosipilaceae bacterium]
MTAILYLLRRQIINWIKQLRHNKSKLLTLIFWVVFMLLIFGSTLMGDSAPDSEAGSPAAEFRSGVMIVLWTVLIAFMATIAMFQGTKEGSSMFKSPDIHFVFTAPLRSQTVLVYGMLKSLSSVFISTFFMIFQLPNMRNMGLSGASLLILFTSWFLVVVVSQLATMALYLFLFDRPYIQTLAKGLIIVLPILMIVLYVGMLLHSGAPYVEHLLPSLVAMLKSPLLLLIPILGWATSFMMTAFIGLHTWAYVGMALLLLSAVGMSIYISRSKADFYEDAMGLTQKFEARIARQKQGYVPKIKKIGKTGLNHGWGMNAIYYRQLREYRRKNPFLITPAAIFYTAIGGQATAILWTMDTSRDIRTSGQRTLAPMVFFVAVILVMYFHGMFSSLIAELKLPIFYISPGKPMGKLLQASRLGLVKILVDQAPALIFLLVLFRLNPFVWLSLILAILSVHLLIGGSQLIVYRLMGSVKGTIETLIQLLIQAVALGPTLIVTIVTFTLLSLNLLSFVWLSLLLIALINVGLYFACLAAGVNILKNGLER